MSPSETRSPHHDRAVHFLMAIHCHQPVGNFGFVFEEAFQRAYEPFLAVLERHPTIHLTLHYSGSLLDWLVVHRPDFLQRLRRLAQAGQIEFLASGYYEPILSLIPEADRQGQIAFMRDAIRTRFGRTATGLWLTERVWEPELPQTLAHCGIQYTLLDTNQFQQAKAVLPPALQVQDEEWWDLLGCYVTEYAGASVVLFPTSKRLRYWIPFQEVARSIEFLKRVTRERPLAITYGDDGEKFGLWPKTHALVYEEGWLEQFFSALERESSWLSTSTCSEYLDRVGPSGRVYLPCGSYDEMLEWSGGYFRNFLVKYPEANTMHHKMLYVSEQVQACGRRSAASSTKRATVLADGKRLAIPQVVERARRELYQAQCNDAYWHGVFGGLYLAPLRHAVYSHLITAERLLNQVQRPRRTQESRDLDGDGRPEMIVRSPALSMVIDPAEDGTITELDCSQRGVNLVDTLARRYEPYHEKLKHKRLAPVAGSAQTPASIHDLLTVKEQGLDAFLAYDDHRRSLFLDYALSTMPTLQEIYRSTWGEHRLWSGGPWELQRDSTRQPSDRTTVTLVRRVQDRVLRKTVTLLHRQARLVFRYEVEGSPIPVVGLEFNLCLRDPRWGESGWQDAVAACQIQDPGIGVTVAMTIDPPAALARFPIETVSESEEGLERTPQGLAVICLWPTPHHRRWSCELAWSIEEP